MRPDTVFTGRACASSISNPRRSNNSYNAIQYTPVDSIATIFTPHSCSQSASACSSRVYTPKRLTDCAAASLGAAT